MSLWANTARTPGYSQIGFLILSQMAKQAWPAVIINAFTNFTLHCQIILTVFAIIACCCRTPKIKDLLWHESATMRAVVTFWVGIGFHGEGASRFPIFSSGSRPWNDHYRSRVLLISRPHMVIVGIGVKTGRVALITRLRHHSLFYLHSFRHLDHIWSYLYNSVDLFW